MIVGIDAGGTNLRLAVSRRGEPLTEVTEVTEVTEATPLIAAAADDGGPEPLRTLVATADFDRNAVVSVAAGITKISRAGVGERWKAVLHALFPQALIQVVPDFRIAFYGAVPTGVGVSALAGTGSVMYGENGDGCAVRVGGRGWEYGDEGSGAWLTTEVIRRSIRALDGREETTPLCRAVCDHLGESEDAGKLGEAARCQTQALGRGFLVPLLLAHAEAGDGEAANLFVGAAGWIGAQVRTTLRRLAFETESRVTIARVGGLWDAGPVLTVPFTQVIRRWYPQAEIRDADAPPLAGALRLAQQRAVAVR